MKLQAPQDTHDWRPLLLRAHVVLLSRFSLDDVLLVLPPSAQQPTLTLLPDPGSNWNSAAPRVLAFSGADDRTEEAMFTYIRRGALDAARQSMAIHQIEHDLQNKTTNPVKATLAAYTLLRIGNYDRADWVKNLASWFKYLPDGAIVYGWYLIREGQAASAGRYFHMAIERGLPMYSEGVRLLRDGMNVLSDLFPVDSQITADALRARRIAGAANLDSELTTLRLGKKLAVNITPAAVALSQKRRIDREIGTDRDRGNTTEGGTVGAGA